MRNPICPYCDSPAKLVSGKYIYPRYVSLHKDKFWKCPNCDAYVGCHKGTARPLGVLANAELRKAKIAAHRAFDYFWRHKQMSRGFAYKWLAQQLQIKRSKCHIGMFNVDMCNKVISICKDK